MRRAAAALALGAAGLLLAGCAPSPPRAPDAVWLVERVTVHCYRTLGEPDCYPVPRPGERHRLIGAAPTLRFSPL